MLDRVVVASNNPDKAREMRDVLLRLGLVGEVVEGLAWPEVAEEGATLEENARHKAEAVSRATGLPALADDTGLEVRALGGRPGVRSARLAGQEATYEDNVAALLRALRGKGDRSATFRTVVVLAQPQGVTLVAEGRLEGRIAESPRGGGGFGYDPIFEVGGRTLAEMSVEEKNLVSHRRRALEALATLLGRPSMPG